MPHWQIRDPEQKHMVSRKPEESSSVIEQAKTQFEDAPKNPKRGTGRRKSKGSNVHGKHNLHVDEHSSSNKSIVFKQRPGFGQSGSKCIVKANYFLTDLSKSEICDYSVSLMLTLCSSLII